MSSKPKVSISSTKLNEQQEQFNLEQNLNHRKQILNDYNVIEPSNQTPTRKPQLTSIYISNDSQDTEDEHSRTKDQTKLRTSKP